MQMILAIGSAAADFAQLLGVRYIPNEPAHSGPIGRLIESALLANNRGDLLRVEAELSRLRLFLKHLQEIKDGDQQTFARLRRRLINETPADYHGVRQEALVAAKLCRSAIPFLHERPGRPDFVVASNEDVGIECTSIHFRNETDDPAARIAPAIERKRPKPYASPGVALAIGVTEIDYRTNLGSELRPAAEQALSETPYGAAVLFTEVLLREKHEYHALYRRIDGDNISGDLKAMLDGVWPKGKLGNIGPWAISGGQS